jgi:hypothetical protein
MMQKLAQCQAGNWPGPLLGLASLYSPYTEFRGFRPMARRTRLKHQSRLRSVANAAEPATATAPATGDVVLTAKETVWARVYDANDKVLFEKEMVAGERYLVPADANNPKIRTGRADLITVTVGGKEVAALGPAERTIKDVGISAAALAARPPVLPPPSAAAPIAGNSMAAPNAQP